MPRLRLWPALAAALALLCLALPAGAAERIVKFHSDIQVFTDASMEVTEHITVQAEGRDIKRGIYRDFPTRYEDRFGNDYAVGFELLDVRRDDRREDYHTERLDNGIRIYMGNKDRHLKPGRYTYSLTYRTNRQLGFFDGHDELYWNVTGTGWMFPIERASATVTLPGAVPPGQLTLSAYTGPQGAKGQTYRAVADASSEAYFTTTAALGKREGLTIVVEFPKGVVQEPDLETRVGWLLRDNAHLLSAAIGLVGLLVYYLLVWLRVGRDPEAGVVIPLYRPPKRFTPAATRFIRRMGYDHKAFATALVNLAVKGLVTIDERDGKYVIARTDTPESTVEEAPGEHALIKHLFRGARREVVLEQKHHSLIKGAIDAHKDALKRNYQKVYFLTNSGWLVPGILITLLGLGGSVLMIGGEEARFGTLFMMLWLSGWSVAVVLLGWNAYNAWRSASSAAGFGRAIGATLFALPFFAGEVGGLFALTHFASLTMVFVLLAYLGLNLVFYHLLKAPTRAGRRLLDKIDGFRLYLEVAEKEELQLKNPPEKTPELFERYLPYALALDVEQQWAEKFAAVFAGLASDGRDTRPHWYHGRHWHHSHPGAFVGAVGSSLGSAVSSSSTAPGSSSGGGGGGSSGGGGGGGGGGGW